jgi:hypothetical protein
MFNSSDGGTMKKFTLFSMVILFTTATSLELYAMEGFYKDLFYDAGVGLDDQSSLVAGDFLKLSYEFYSGEDSKQQNLLMVRNEYDDNGVLLYPDGEPRFRILYTCGGYGEHASSLGTEGKQRVRDFYYHGGSYNGSCHGNYLAWNWGYNIWPGKMSVDTYEGYVDGVIPDNSPLLKYYDFGGDHLIKNLEHYQGGYAIEPLPAKTEILLIGKSAGNAINGDGHPTGWAYKAHDTTGRLCGMCDHPEYARSGECMQYHAACILYCLDGVAPPHVKAVLENGKIHNMDKSTVDKDFTHTKIGDKQYHHFCLDVPNGAGKLTVSLDGDDAYDLNLYLAKDTFAFASRAKYADSSKGADKILSVPVPEAGRWFIGVECASTVITAPKAKWGYEYTGNLGVLNGVKYSIKAELTGETSVSKDKAMQKLIKISPIENNLSGKTDIPVSCNSRLYDLTGRLRWESGNSQIDRANIRYPMIGAGVVISNSGKENGSSKSIITSK